MSQIVIFKNIYIHYHIFLYLKKKKTLIIYDNIELKLSFFFIFKKLMFEQFKQWRNKNESFLKHWLIRTSQPCFSICFDR